MARWASAFSGTVWVRRSNRRAPSGSPSYRSSMSRPRTILAHWLMNATKRESHPVRLEVSKSQNLTEGSLIKASRTSSTRGSAGRSRQFPDNRATNASGDTRSTTRFGMEAVVIMWLQGGHIKAQPPQLGGRPFGLDAPYFPGAPWVPLTPELHRQSSRRFHLLYSAAMAIGE